MRPPPSEAVLQAERSIAAGSQSFAAATRLFDAATRESAVLLYAWCRHCDDVIDGQVLGHAVPGPTHAVPGPTAQEASLAQVATGHLLAATSGACVPLRSAGAAAEHSAALQRLAELQERSFAACAGRPDGDPVYRGLAEVVRRHAIAPELPMEHLAGFAMDVHGLRYDTLEELLVYCWRVAGVVGVMMARVMGATRDATLDRASDLGLAFQLTNIARDVVDDAACGRLYLPQAWLRADGIAGIDDVLDPARRDALARVARRLTDGAEPYYRSAVAGIGELPLRCAWSIASARGIYRAIGRKVAQQGPRAWNTRQATTRAEKLWLVARGAAVALVAHGLAPQPRPAQLFRRPL